MKSKIPLSATLTLIIIIISVISCINPIFNSKKHLPGKQALKLLENEATRRGLNLIKNKFSFSSDGIQSIAHALIEESTESSFQNGIPISLLLLKNTYLTRDRVSYIEPGIYTLKYQIPDFRRKLGKTSATLILEGGHKKYYFEDVFELEVVSLGNSNELASDYQISIGFCGISKDKKFKFLSFDFRRYLNACDCCIKPPKFENCEFHPTMPNSNCNFETTPSPN